MVHAAFPICNGDPRIQSLTGGVEVLMADGSSRRPIPWSNGRRPPLLMECPTGK